jgi:glutathione S-transferase
MKTQILLKIANLPYRTDNSGFRAAPKGKIPYIDDDSEIVADSTFIRWHLEKKYGLDFDAGLTLEQRAIAWAFEKMAEEHLYWQYSIWAGWTTPTSPTARRCSSNACPHRCVRSSSQIRRKV